MKTETAIITKTRLTAALTAVLMVGGLFRFFTDQHPVNAQNGQNSESGKVETIQPKYALLVGITKYKNGKINEIPGCENNVSLLAETLIKDFGFAENNVVSLSNERATRDEIYKNFQTHLIGNAKKAKADGKEAVVVYYFCGHGSQFADQDGDENDGKDETFVAYDSRTANVFDVLDDEIDDLKAELRPYTTNTTLILESCHSGTGSRGDARESQLVSQETDEDARKRIPYKRKFPATSDADTLSYTELAASLSSNTAKSETKEFCGCDKPLSLMTKALVQGLARADHSTTYRGLMREVSAEVAANSRQEPQVEGNRDALLFGGAAKRTKPYIEIEKILSGDQVTIKAGTIHGLKIGSQVSFYSSESLINTGKDYWLTNGTVSRVGNAASIVNVPTAMENAKVKDLKITSHAVLASPVFGGGSVLLALAPNDARDSEGRENDLHKKIEARLRNENLLENQILKIVPTDKISAAEKNEIKGIVRLKKGKVKDVFADASASKTYPMSPLTDKTPGNEGALMSETACEGENLIANGSDKRFPAADAEVYYLDEGEAGGAPLFGRTFDPADKNAADRIADAVRDFAYQNNLRGLDNAASDLSSRLRVSVWSLPADAVIGRCVKNQTTDLWEKKYSPDNKKFKGFQEVKNNRVELNSFFQLKIKNVSGEINKKTDKFAGGEPFYISVLALTTAGEIKNVYPNRLSVNDAVKDAGEIAVTIKMTEPVGVERFIIVVSKDNVDFSFYETAKGTKRNPKSILERLLTQSGMKTRDAGTLVDEPDRWDVIHLELNITEK